MKTIAPIILFSVVCHYLAVFALTSKITSLSSIVLCLAVIAGGLWLYKIGFREP